MPCCFKSGLPTGSGILAALKLVLRAEVSAASVGTTVVCMGYFVEQTPWIWLSICPF